MSLEIYPHRISEPDAYTHVVAFTNASTSLAKTFGKGVTVTSGGTGLYTLTFGEYPGIFMAYNGELQATTMSALKQFTTVLGAFDSTGKIVQVTIYNASGTGTDLAANQWLTMLLLFKRSAAAV